MRNFFVVGNWKMNGTIEETLKLIAELRHKLASLKTQTEVVVAPPFTALYSASIVIQEETSIKLAAQNMHWEPFGAYTGEISAVFLKDAGCTHVILGHSERRNYFGETDEMINQKLQTALANELTPIVCIGETLKERKAGKTESVLERQIKKGFAGLPMSDLKSVVIAYEPIWAIGTGQAATMKEIEEALYFIRNFVAKSYDAPTANEMRLLYGGSVTPETAKSISEAKELDGFLVGGASLSIDKFLKIIRGREN